jgi:hypothetical protein
MATLLKMRQERERKAKKPNIGAGHEGHHRKYLDRAMGMSRQGSQHPFEHLLRPPLVRNQGIAGCWLGCS